jgi:hypothetical protein
MTAWAVTNQAAQRFVVLRHLAFTETAVEEIKTIESGVERGRLSVALDPLAPFFEVLEPQPLRLVASRWPTEKGRNNWRWTASYRFTISL